LRSGARHLLSKDEAAQFIAQPPYLLGVAGSAEALGELKECLFFLLLRFDSLFDELDQNAVIAEGAPLSYGLDLLGNLRWE